MADFQKELANIVHRKNARWEKLYSRNDIVNAPKDPVWRIYINIDIEVDI